MQTVIRKNVYTSVTYSVMITGQKQRSDKHINFSGCAGYGKVRRYLRAMYKGSVFQDVKIIRIEYPEKEKWMKGLTKCQE